MSLSPTDPAPTLSDAPTPYPARNPVRNLSDSFAAAAATDLLLGPSDLSVDLFKPHELGQLSRLIYRDMERTNRAPERHYVNMLYQTDYDAYVTYVEHHYPFFEPAPRPSTCATVHHLPCHRPPASVAVPPMPVVLVQLYHNR